MRCIVLAPIIFEIFIQPQFVMEFQIVKISSMNLIVVSAFQILSCATRVMSNI